MNEGTEKPAVRRRGSCVSQPAFEAVHLRGGTWIPHTPAFRGGSLPVWLCLPEASVQIWEAGQNGSGCLNAAPVPW